QAPSGAAASPESRGVPPTPLPGRGREVTGWTEPARTARPPRASPIDDSCRRAVLDEADIRAFVSTDYPRLVAGLAVVLGGRAAAEDAVQEALVRAWERSRRGETIESLRSGVAVVAMNLLRRRLGRRATGW